PCATQQRIGAVIACEGDAQVVVGGQCVFDKLRQQRITEVAPEAVVRNDRRRLRIRTHGAECLGRRQLWPHVVGPDAAGGQRKRKEGGSKRRSRSGAEINHRHSPWGRRSAAWRGPGRWAWPAVGRPDCRCRRCGGCPQAKESPGCDQARDTSTSTLPAGPASFAVRVTSLRSAT